MSCTLLTPAGHRGFYHRIVSVLCACVLHAIPLIAQSPASAPAPADPDFARWLAPQAWPHAEEPALSLGEKGAFDDEHMFAPHVVFMDGEYWMYYCGSQKCITAGVYKGAPKNKEHPEQSDQRLYKLGLAKSKDGIHFKRVSTEPILSFGDDIHSIVTPCLLKNPDGSVLREKGKLRLYFAAVDFPGGTYKHDIYETTSEDGVHWAKPSLVMEMAYAPCVIKEGDKYRLWYTCIPKNPWKTNYADSTDGTHFTIRNEGVIVIDQKWEVKDQVYPFVIKVGDVYLMMYGCYWADEWHTGIGFAVSKDGIKWTKHPDNPVIRPDPKHEWESNFNTSQTLMRLPDGSYRVWYAARRAPEVVNGRKVWTHLYYAIGTAHWKGLER